MWKIKYILTYLLLKPKNLYRGYTIPYIMKEVVLIIKNKIKTKEIIIKVESQEEFFNEQKKIFKDLDKGILPKKRFSYSFEKLEEYRKTLTQKRLELLSVIRHKKPKSIYELSKMVNRNFKNVSDDINILKEVGLIEIKEKNTPRKVIIPSVNFDKLRISIPI